MKTLRSEIELRYEIARLKRVIEDHLSPFLAEAEIDVGPGYDYWYCPICQEQDYNDKDKIKHKGHCYWYKEKENGKAT